MTYTEEIFSSKCPYNHIKQGNRSKLLFVCSAGMLRSPTAAVVANQRGFNTRSCGSSLEIALIPISTNLIAWADTIFFMHESNYDRTLAQFVGEVTSKYVRTKAVIWDIPDRFAYMDVELVVRINKLLDYQAETTRQSV